MRKVVLAVAAMSTLVSSGFALDFNVAGIDKFKNYTGDMTMEPIKDKLVIKISMQFETDFNITAESKQALQSYKAPYRIKIRDNNGKMQIIEYTDADGKDMGNMAELAIKQ